MIKLQVKGSYEGNDLIHTRLDRIDSRLDLILNSARCHPLSNNTEYSVCIMRSFSFQYKERFRDFLILYYFIE